MSKYETTLHANLSSTGNNYTQQRQSSMFNVA